MVSSIISIFLTFLVLLPSQAISNDISGLFENPSLQQQQQQYNRYKYKNVLYDEHRHHNGAIRHQYLNSSRIKRRKNMNNKRRLISSGISDAFNDYITVAVGKHVAMDCKLENYNNEKV
jgi:hypothetical protein